MYKLIKRENHARRGELQTVHGTVQTPAFMNVATAAAIKGAVSAYDLKDIKCQVMLSNTYRAMTWGVKWAAYASLPAGTALY